jgi:hypothetical protein
MQGHAGTREPVLVVSPHPDDAAYSVGGLLSGRVLGRAVAGATAFTRSPVVQYGQPILSRLLGRPLDVLTSQPRVNRVRERIRVLEVSRLRKREDVGYFKAIGVPRTDLDLLDAPLRGYGWSPWVSDTKEVLQDPIFKTAVSLFGDLIMSLSAPQSSTADASGRTRARSPCVLLLPLGIGGHVDHLIVREACSGLTQDHVSVYYEDLPYAERATEGEIERVVDDFEPALEPHLFGIKASMAQKVQNLRLFRTQVGDKEVERVVRYSKRLKADGEPCERLWYGRLPEDSASRVALEEAERSH